MDYAFWFAGAPSTNQPHNRFATEAISPKQACFKYQTAKLMRASGQTIAIATYHGCVKLSLSRAVANLSAIRFVDY